MEDLKERLKELEIHIEYIKPHIKEFIDQLKAMNEELTKMRLVTLERKDVEDIKDFLFLFRTARSIWTKFFVGLVIVGAGAAATAGFVVKYIPSLMKGGN